MNRLQKKCVIVVSGVHALLLLVLIVGPAFIPAQRPLDLPIIEFIPVITTDKMISGGGDPTVKSPPAEAVTPPVAPPKPPDRPAPTPTPVREVVQPVKPVEPTRPRIQVSKQSITRPVAEARPPRDNSSRQSDDAKRQMEAVNRVLEGIKGGVAGSTEIRLAGPGGGGLPYANWMQAVLSKYKNTWIVPDGVTDASTIAVVSVTIARDGSVISSRITRPSGNTLVDRSVQMTLDRVRFAAPLPADSTESQRTVTIEFDVRAKLAG